MNKMRIDIDTRTFVRFWLVVIGFALVAYAIYSARTALFIVGAALFLAIALNPPVSRLAKLFPSKSRVLGTALAYIAVVAILSAIIFLVVPPIVDQTVKFAQTVPSLVDNATKQYAGVSNFINSYHLQPQVDEVLVSVKNSATQFATGIGPSLISSIGSIVTVIITSILVLVLAFLMLIEGPTWMKQIWGLYDNQGRMEHHRKLLYQMYSVVTSYVGGQLSVSAIAGISAGIVVGVLSIFFNIPISLAIPAAAIMFILSLIPLFGETIGAFIMALVLLLNDPMAALIFAIYFLIYQQVEGNFIIPKIQSKRIGLSALAILVSVVTGIILFGIAGGIISIPIAGCINILLNDYISRSRKTKANNTEILSSK